MRAVLAVVGPTAAGKSDLAVDLALELRRRAGVPAEIVNADSMQLYRGMDIGTAKLPVAERRGVPHHLLDVLDIDQPASVALVQQLARVAIAACHDAGRLPIVVGGSALYVHGVLDDLAFPGTDPVVRARLEAQAAELGPARFHTLLSERDPEAGRAIDPGNVRRMVRALEVVELTGRPFRATLPEPRYVHDPVLTVGLELDRPSLDRRIADRVGRIFAHGFVVEVAALDRQGLRTAPTASKALGYRQVLDLLDGTVDDERARASTAAATRRFARRQLTWFRRDHRIHWLPADLPRADLVERTLALLVPILEDGRPWGTASGRPLP